MRDESSKSTGPESPDGPTCGPSRRLWPTPIASVGRNLDESPEQWDERRARVKAKGINGNGMGDQLAIEAQRFPTGPAISYAADSPAKISALPGKAPASLGNGRGFGMSSPASFASFDPDSCSWKTSQRCLFGGSIPYSERWPRSGMTRNGIAYRLPPLAPRTSATAFSSWPTPRATDGSHGGPNQRDSSGSRPLPAAVHRFPSPTASDYKGSCLPGQRAGQLSEAIEPAANADRGDSIPRMTLNPAWVEWLMGFPPGWTDLGDSGTRSFRKSPSGSADASLNLTGKGGPIERRDEDQK